MQTIDANGAQLHMMLFLEFFHQARKLAPTRFLTLRLHPNRYRELQELAVAPEVVQMGETPGPLGRKILRVNCVKPPIGLGDGVAIEQSEEADPSKLQCLIHGVSELELVHLKP